ncbi:Holliday junction resolvase MOC1, chloroplastic [Linum perenne]
MEVLQVKPQNLTSSTSQLPFMRFPGVKPFFCNAFSSAIPPTKRGCAFRVIAHLKATTAAAEVARLKENWLDSLTCPLPVLVEEEVLSSTDTGADSSTASGSNWIVGIDPDLSGAIALLKTEESICSAQVFDAPSLKVMVGKRIRKRLDAKSIVQLLRSFDSPVGTIAYIEQSIPFPQDGKQGWWSGGFGYGLWIGILVASGYSVVPVPSLTWKNKFRLTGENATKDDSRKLASTLFPSLSSSLTRKKDHGRAEALLIAAYGKGMMMNSTVTCNVEELPQDDDD